MAKKEKTFNSKLYAVIVFFAVAAALVILVTTSFKSRYTAFHPEEVAKTYVDTIAQTGDGYNAYKNSLLSKSDKYGDFIRKNYMNPIINREAEEKGYNDESFMGEKTKNDDGSLQGEVIDIMYDYYVTLIEENKGWDNYDIIFSSYLNKLVEVRKEVFGDDYMSDEIMFTALEGNVATYGDSLTGTELTVDENTGITLTEKALGRYEEVFGENYKIKTTVSEESKAIALDTYKAEMGEDVLALYEIEKDDIEEVRQYEVKVSAQDTEVICNVTVVRIGSSWYVDPVLTNTEALYSIGK